MRRYEMLLLLLMLAARLIYSRIVLDRSAVDIYVETYMAPAMRRACHARSSHTCRMVHERAIHFVVEETVYEGRRERARSIGVA